YPGCEGCLGFGAPDAAEGFDRGEPYLAVGVLEGAEERCGRGRVRHSSECADGGPTKFAAALVEMVSHDGEGTWITELTECAERRNPHLGGFVPQGLQERVERATRMGAA